MAVDKKLAALPAVKQESELLSLLKGLDAGLGQAEQGIALKKSELQQALASANLLKSDLEALLKQAVGRPVAIKA